MSALGLAAARAFTGSLARRALRPSACVLRLQSPMSFSTAAATPPPTALEPLGVLAPHTRVLRLQSRPVNSLSLEVLRSLLASLDEAEADASCRAIVLASAQPSVFSAGLDITELYRPQPERLNDFWSAVQEIWLKLSTSRVATVAAIEGHAPAGGCLLALSCDYRVMSTGLPSKDGGGSIAKPFTIGLNETRLGIVAPYWFADLYSYVVGARRADFMLQTGALLPAESASAIGLVDEAVPHEQVSLSRV